MEIIKKVERITNLPYETIWKVYEEIWKLFLKKLKTAFWSDQII